MEFREQVPLAPYTTLRVGGRARWFGEAASVDDIREALRFAREQQVGLFVLGGGSNLLVSDQGFPGLVLRIALRGLEFEGDSLNAAAGEDWDAVVLASVEAGLAGIECLSGIPGTTGGTPIQNVGAYGQEVSSTIAEVEAIDAATGGTVSLSGEDCGFGYRRSRFHRRDAAQASPNLILTSVCYKLREAAASLLPSQPVYPELQRALRDVAKPTLADVRQAVMQLRRGKGMLLVEGDPDSRSAGSFFKNPIVTASLADEIAATAAEMPRWDSPSGGVKLSAAWLIERAGYTRGFALGGAGISSKHTLALVNRDSATAAEIAALRDLIAGGVYERFEVALQQEPVNVP